MAPALTAAALAVGAIAMARHDRAHLALVFALVPAFGGAVVDAVARRVPDRFTVLTAVPSLAVLVAGTSRALGDDLAVSTADALAGAALLAGPLLVLHLVDPTAMGFGDVKLAVALGLGIGLLDPMSALPALVIASGVTTAVGLALRWRSAPFAPGLVLGAALVAVLAATTDLPGVGQEGLPWL